MTLIAWGWTAWSVGWIVAMCLAYLPWRGKTGGKRLPEGSEGGKPSSTGDG